MNSIPSINVATTPNTSFKGVRMELARAILDHSEKVHTGKGIIGINFNVLIASIRELIPHAISKHSRQTLQDTKRITGDLGTTYLGEGGLINQKFTIYERRDPHVDKLVRKVFDNKGRYIRTQHEYNNGYTVITDSNGHWTVLNFNDEPKAKTGRFKNINQVLSFIKKNWNPEKNILEPKIFEEDTAKKAAE